ncbi:hypothetical protein B0J14DRAFT_704673 [Halenospora varia]|nr:hypothetical protein B0J14DRAFT_704673 [Halenospora varia]
MDPTSSQSQTWDPSQSTGSAELVLYQPQPECIAHLKPEELAHFDAYDFAAAANYDPQANLDRGMPIQFINSKAYHRSRGMPWILANADPSKRWGVDMYNNRNLYVVDPFTRTLPEGISPLTLYDRNARWGHWLPIQRDALAEAPSFMAAFTAVPSFNPEALAFDYLAAPVDPPAAVAYSDDGEETVRGGAAPEGPLAQQPSINADNCSFAVAFSTDEDASPCSDAPPEVSLTQETTPGVDNASLAVAYSANGDATPRADAPPEEFLTQEASAEVEIPSLAVEASGSSASPSDSEGPLTPPPVSEDPFLAFLANDPFFKKWSVRRRPESSKRIYKIWASWAMKETPNGNWEFLDQPNTGVY